MAQPRLSPNSQLLNGSSQQSFANLQQNARVIEKSGTRILCIADVRGNLSSLNELAKTNNAQHIIHTGDFGFYDETSLDRIADKTLKHVAQYSPLLTELQKKTIQSPPQGINIKAKLASENTLLSELALFLKGDKSLNIPVYTVWGACEDVRVLEKFRAGEYKINNLHIIDESSSRLLEVGGVKLRLLGLGGAVVMHKLFDNGDGKTTIAGGQGTMWTTLLQMGELVDTANRVYDPSETRIFITHASPAREGLLNQLSVTLKSDFSISAGLHFRYGSSYNEFSVNPTLDQYRAKLASSKASFQDVWETVKSEVQPAVDANPGQAQLLKNALDVVEKMPTAPSAPTPFGGNTGAGGGNVDESAFKNMWNFNLADAAFGWLILEVDGGRIGTEMRAQGFNFAHRSQKPQTTASQAQAANANQQAAEPTSATSAAAPSLPAAMRNQKSTPVQQTASPVANKTANSNANPADKSRGTPIPRTGTPTSNAPPAVPAKDESQNGVSPTLESPAIAAGGASTPTTERRPFQERYPHTQGLHIVGVDTEDAVRQIFKPEDEKLIKVVDKRQQTAGPGTYFFVFFNSETEREAAYNNIENNVKERNSSPHVSRMRESPFARDGSRGGRGGMRSGGSWGRGDARGGNAGQQSSASESENNKNRGERGERGEFNKRASYRGRGRGRGGPREADSTSAASPAGEPAK